MTESCSSAAVAGDVDVLRLELVEAAASGSGGAAHLSTSEVAPAVEAADDEAAAAAASARRPRMKSLSEELEPHYEEPDEALSEGEGIAIDSGIKSDSLWESCRKHNIPNAKILRTS